MRPSTRASLVTSRTYHSLSTRLHTGFRETSARNHREHNLIHQSHSRRTGSYDRLSIEARSKYRKLTGIYTRKGAKLTHTTDLNLVDELPASVLVTRTHVRYWHRGILAGYSTHGGGQVATITDVGVRALSCALSIRQTPPNPTSRTLTTVLHEDAIFVYMRLEDPEVRSLPSDFFVARSKVRSFDFLLRRLTSRVGISRLVQSSFRCIDRVYSSRDLLSTSLCDRIFKSVSLLKMDLSCDFLFFFFFLSVLTNSSNIHTRWNEVGDIYFLFDVMYFICLI